MASIGPSLFNNGSKKKTRARFFTITMEKQVITSKTILNLRKIQKICSSLGNLCVNN